MRKFGGFIVAAACGISLMGFTCGGDDSSSPLDAGDGIDSSTTNGDATANGDTSATNDGGTEASAGPGTVTGIVKENVPIPGAKILIGTATATTGADGKFTIPDVTDTYTMTVVIPQFGGGTGNVITYVGLTTRTPVVINPFALATSVLHSNSSVVSANVSGTGLPLAGGTEFRATLLSAMRPENITIGSSFPLSFNWATTNDLLSADLYAYVESDTNNAIVSMAVDPGVVLPTDGGTVYPPNLGLVTPGFTTIGGTYSAPAGYTVDNGDTACIISPSANEGVIFIGATDTATSSYMCSVPVGLGFGFAAAEIFAEGENGAQATRTVVAPGNAGTIDITLDAPSVITAPADNATGVDLTQPFTWTTPTGSSPVTYSLDVEFNDNKYVVVGTSIGSATLPDLSAFGIALPTASDGATAVVIDTEGVVMDDFVDGKTVFQTQGTGSSQTVDFATP